MATHRCPNQKCEYFNRPLPNNVKFCPLCSTPLGNVIPEQPSSPSQSHLSPGNPPAQSPQPAQPAVKAEFSSPLPVDNSQNYLSTSTASAPIPPSVPSAPNYPSNYPSSDVISTQYQHRSPAQTPVAPPSSHNPSPQKIPTLKLVHTSGREFFLPGEQGIIGRRSSGEPNFIPDIDLSVIPNQGVVSRRHGRIYWDWSQNTYMIVDMSTNGIYLNNNLLNPGVPYRLINGVPIQLGQDALVNFTVFYV